MYQYETKELVSLVEESGAQVGMGSYSCIAALEHLGCAGFNWGVGYQDYHGARSHAWLEDTFRMVARFEKFYQANGSTWLTHDKADDWWDKDECLVAADCGHGIDLADESTYIEEANWMVCVECGTLDFTTGEQAV